MASTTMIECSSLKPFNMADGELSSLGQRWNRWKRSFDYFIVAKGVTDALQKQALLLHLAGPEVQDIFDTLPQAEGEDVYEQTVNALSSYFQPHVNTTYERYLFRQIQQNADETVDQFFTRM